MRYGFRIRVVPPHEFDHSQLTGWKIFTLDKNRQYVDGNFDSVFRNEPGTVSFTENLGTQHIFRLTSTSWGIYQHELNSPEEGRCGIDVNDMRPHSHSGVVSRLTFCVQNLEQDLLETRLRIVAPYGYEFLPTSPLAWKTVSANFSEVYIAPGGWRSTPAVSGDFPPLAGAWGANRGVSH